MNLMKKFIALTCAFVLLFSLSACTSEDEKTAAFSGTWELSSVSNNNGDNSEDIMEQLGKSGLEYQLVMNADGSGTLDLAGTQSELTWEAQSTSEAIITSENNEIAITLEDGSLTMAEGDLTMTFTKSDASGDDSVSDASGDAASTDASGDAAASDSTSGE